MSGLVVEDLGGGDACWTIVDDALWEQIRELQASFGDAYDAEAFKEWIGALVCTDPEVAWPAGCPLRVGSVVRRFFTQTHAIEQAVLDGIVGVLTL